MMQEKFGPYRIKSRIGAGGMGDVYLAEEQKTYFTREVVLKLVKDELNQGGKSRFLDEMRMLASLEHENIARMYDGGSESGRLFIAMEYVRDGVSLRQYMLDPSQGKQRALRLDQVLTITRQLCEGFEAAHKKGIVHRDLKPENIIITPQEDGLRVKIIDFGIAASVAPGVFPQSDRQLTQGICGTPHYLSPEQAAGKNRSEIDHRSDIYSLGLVVYEMITGVLAFEGDFVTLLRLHLQNDPIPIPQLCPHLGLQLGQALDQVVMKALKKRPDERHQSMKGFARELEAAVQAPMRRTEIPAPPRSQAPPPVPAYKPWSIGRWIFLAFAAVVLIVVSFIGVVILQAALKVSQNPSPTANVPAEKSNSLQSGASTPPGRGKPTAPAVMDASKLVGSWQADIVIDRNPAPLFVEFNADGTSNYRITSSREFLISGRWRYSNGFLYETYSDGSVAQGQLNWVDKNHVVLTILNNGNPRDRGTKREYYRVQ